MRQSSLNRPAQMFAGLITGLLFATLALPLNAQSKHESQPYYDAAKETTISGTVSNVIAKHSEGMLFGSHLILETGSGPLDASLGKWAMQGKGALSVAPGQVVEVTGVMKTIKQKEVFIVRTLKADGQTFTIRNKNGVPMSPQSREHASLTATQIELNGGAR